MNAPQLHSFFRASITIAPRPPMRGARFPVTFLVAFVLLCHSGPVGAQTPDAPSDVRAASHFLEQATFGPSAADVATLESLGAPEWLNQQFAMPASAMPDNLDTSGVRNRMFLNMVNGPDQLRQRMMFALSQTLVVSANKVGSGPELIPWVKILSDHAFGNYRTLLEEVTLSPTMGKFLDLAYSRKESRTSSPNENYPREMLQLFTIGLWQLNQDGTVTRDASGQPMPVYTQDTIREYARAMTGWSFAPPIVPGQTNYTSRMVPNQNTHDIGPKTLLSGVVLPGNLPAAADMVAALDSAFNHPNVPPFVSTRLIRSLVTSNPSPAYVRRVANVFANNGAGVRGDLRAVLAAILLDSEALTFRSAQDGRLKDPVMHVIGLARALGATVTDPGTYMYVFSNLSQQILTPTTVFSFYSPMSLLPGHFDLFGPEFQIYPPALAIQRANFIYGLLNAQYGTGFALNRGPYTALAGNVPALVELVNQRMMFGRMSNELRQIITAATLVVPVSDVNQRALGALYLAAISSEYSVFGSNTVTGETTVQPPTGVAVASIVGNLVTLRWVAPSLGPAPTSYVLEGGVNRGDVLASMPTGSNAPTFIFTVPPGSFYVRIHSMAGGARSRASSEIRLHVGVPTGPTAPANLMTVIHGARNELGVSWRNTFAGGAATGMVLDVTGSIVASMPLPVGESFTVPNVPAGTYTFSVRAVNAAGSSGSSNSKTVTFPRTGCSGKPQMPTNFMVAASGRTLSLAWQAAVSGEASISYIVSVGGGFAGRLPTTARTMSGGVGPGLYTINVRAVNACGEGTPTATRTVTVQ